MLLEKYVKLTNGSVIVIKLIITVSIF